MANSSQYFFPILIVSVIIIVVFLAVYFNKKNVVMRNLSKFTPKRITQIRTNELTKISGKVVQVTEPFIAPYSKRKCVAYIFKVKQKVKSGKSSHWKTLVKKENIQNFFIEQNGELIMVKPSMENNNYISYIVEDKKVSSGIFNNPTPEFKKVLDDLGVNHENWLGFNRTLKYTERIIEIGETITVGGIAKWKQVKAPIAGHNYSKVAALESSKEQKIIITDHPDAIKPVKRML